MLELKRQAMTLRVAVVTPIFPIPAQPNRGHAVYQCVRALSKYADVKVICPFSCYPRWFQPSFDYRRPDLTYSPLGVKTQYFEYPAFPGLTRCINGKVCAEYVEPYIREYSPDILLNFWLYPEGYAAVEVGRRLGIPAVVCAIGSDLNSIPDPVSRWLTRITMDRAAFVVTKSEHLRRQAIRMGINSRKVRKVLNGCDASIFKLADRGAARRELGIDEHTALLLFVGRLDLSKGVLELLNAFGLLANSLPNLRLAYVGDGPAGERLRRKSRESALRSRIILANDCPPKEVARWLAAANLLALPSYAEGCPNAVIEAMNCGRPVIATNIGGIPELVSDKCGVLIAPRSAPALANAIENAIKRDWNELSISKQFRRGWDEAAGEMLGICELAMQQR